MRLKSAIAEPAKPAHTKVREKIILGTVQLGLSYGVNNSTGKPTIEEAFNILNCAREEGIKILDTADGYGDSLQVIGNYQTETKQKFNIVNKFKVEDGDFVNKFQKSLDQLCSKTLYCYMYHHFPDYENGMMRKHLRELKQSGAIEKIGVSLYEVHQLRKAVNDSDIDIIQLPVNLLDLSVEKETLLKEARSNGKEIHARSVYLQGLFFKKPESLSGNLISMRPYLEELRTVSDFHNLSLKKLALNYVLQKEYIDYVVLGIDHASQLVENTALVDQEFDSEMIKTFKIKPEDAFLLNPANWKP